ncbi:MAG: 4-hydroxybenzoate octaprenyltransferase [Limnobacter sp.]|mgnify:FL=1|jgi:4-hydroxybenzoate polyprenyltransferase|uniref:4-hydroxybenzoate octaprenyltransferase n=1 Tax=Limnobacter sp. TaxID=2003368 RepID=UPI001D430496|nr:4-hydroxybenzoate octaprenyltransferase [Limnobacter sp.]MBA4316117.1 4-hydroxybenzoate octaprenyltransferase [Alcaligenaceae bacterium]MDP3271168.1 4-hydroxybenzoate octaprenyltransferase [Limnobacter sp.]
MAVLSKARLRDYYLLLRLDKPIGILLLMWPTLWGLWMAAEGVPPWHVLLIFVAGVVLMRSAGCAINDYADRDIDLHVERTRNRPLTSGRIGEKEALLLAAGLAVLALLITLPLGWPVILMSIPAAFLAGSYPFTKRFFPMPQAYLGIAFGFSIPMAFVAVQGSVPLHAWLVFAANVFWTVAYDTEYALVDKPDDLKLNIKTAAITLGRYDVVGIVVCYAVSLSIWAWVATSLAFGPAFWLGWVCAVGIAAYHYMLIRNRDRALCFKAFLHNNWLGAALFAGLVLQYL